MYEKGLNSRDYCCTYNAYVGSVEALIVSRDVINSRPTNFRHYGVTYVQKGVLGLILDTGSAMGRGNTREPTLSLRVFGRVVILPRKSLAPETPFIYAQCAFNTRVGDVWWIWCITYSISPICFARIPWKEIGCFDITNINHLFERDKYLIFILFNLKCSTNVSFNNEQR